MKGPIIDAEFTPIRPGCSTDEIKRKRRRQFWAATGKFIALEAALIAAAVVVGAMWR